MAYLIRETGDPHFRFLHSGDLQSPEMLDRFSAVARKLPRVKFWVPTKERQHVEHAGAVPENLVVRVSATMIDGAPPKWAKLTSTITSGENRHGRLCPAKMQGNACGDCRACWDKRVLNVEYELSKAN